ncbi:uncharacterized protein [Sinocyclocheilus grahami]|uniref:uncharacterized protein n=1 Tax=Sinocyclocheilus grahami TaxID=75366 RepID=UPI0007ACA5D3|nr:PREDICTED: uncharacterized protein LOC107574977 [Sinocyclocheilus grahami]
MLWRTPEKEDNTAELRISCQLESRMNFSAQFFANFVNDGLQGQETRRSFNDSEEYDPFWQRWETVACTSETLRESSQCPPESERRDVPGVEFHQHVAVPLCSPSHPVFLHPLIHTHLPVKPLRCTNLDQNSHGDTRLHLHHTWTNPRQIPLLIPLPENLAGLKLELQRADAPQPASKAPVDPAEPSSSVALPAFPQLTENATLLSLLQALVCILLRLFLTFILLFLPRAEQRRGSSKPDCSFHSGPCAKDSRIGNGRVGCRSTLICPERLKDFGAEEYLNEDMKVFETSVSEPPEVQLMSTPKPAVKKSGESKTAALNICALRTSAQQPSNSSRPGFRKHPCSRLS